MSTQKCHEKHFAMTKIKLCHEGKNCHEKTFFHEGKICHDKNFCVDEKICHDKKFCHEKKICHDKKLCHEEKICHDKKFCVARKRFSHGHQIIIGIPKIRFCWMKNVLSNSKEKC